MDTARLLPLTGSSPLALHLVLQEGEGGFVSLSREEDVSRVYLAAIVGAEGTVVELTALKVLPNSFPEVLLSESRVTNPDLVRRFELERERLRELRPSPFFPRLYELAGVSEDARETLPPLFFCRAARAFFTPPCPRCLTPLTTCQDEGFLSEQELPSYAGTLYRLLFCPRCARKTGTPPVYSAQPPAIPGKIPVGSPRDLIGALRETLEGEHKERLLETFPFLADPDAVRSVRPFTSTQTPYLLTGVAPLDLDALADLLGGRPWESLLSEPAAASPVLSLAPFRHAFLGSDAEVGRRFLFAHDASGLDAVEALALKLTAFAQVVQATLQYTRTTGKPHLDIHPRHVLFDLSGAGDGLPLLWTFQARLHGVATAAQSITLTTGEEVVLPPVTPVVPYAPQEVLEFQLAGFRPAELYVTEIVEAGARKQLEGRIVDPYGIYPLPRLGDRIILGLQPEGHDFGFKSLSARLRTSESATSQELQFVSEPVELTDVGSQRLQKALGVRIPGARYRIYPAFDVPSDLFSLGVVLVRLLLGNDAQDIVGLTRSIARALKPKAGETPPLESLRSDPELAAHLGKHNIFYQAMDRAGSRPNAIPEQLWDRAVDLALRLSTRIPGASFCSDHADFDEAHRTEKLERALSEVSLLVAELRSLLFQRQSLNLEIQQVLAEVLFEEARR